MEVTTAHIGYASALFALAAAFFWWRSTLVHTPEKFNVYTWEAGTFQAADAGAPALMGHGSSPELTALGLALVRQSKLNAWGAGCACVSAALSGIASLWPL